MGFYFSILGSLIVYFAAPLFVVRSFLGSSRAALPSLIVFAMAFVIEQLLFALFASLQLPYSIAFVCAAASVIGLGVASFSEHSTSFDSRSIQRSVHWLPWSIFFIVLVLCLWIRSHFPFINFLNNGDDVGVEKLFNLSMQQSFLYGTSYPPEWVWLSGEPIRYYTFLKSFPGLWSFLARAWFGNADTGGVFFLLSESFYTALYTSLVAAWILWFGQHAKNRFSLGCLSVFTGLLTLVGTHAQAFWLGLNGLLSGAGVNWWTLSSQVIKYTDNQYPAWLLMIGDNHAYFQAYFLQVLFWGAFLALVLSERVTLFGASLVGALLAAILISHPGSILVNLCSIGGFVVAYFIWLVVRQEGALIKRLLLNALYASLTAAVFASQLYLPSGEVKFVVPGRDIVSKLVPFLNLNLSVLVCMALFLAAVLFRNGAVKALIDRTKASDWVWVLSLIAGTLACIYGRPALAVMVGLAALTFLTCVPSSVDPKHRQSVLALFAATSFFIWLMPEVIAFDHKMDSRVEWIRFQMSLRFWPEGYILIPLALALAVTEAVAEAKLKMPIIVIGCVVIVVFSLSHIAGFQNRSQRAWQQQTIDGFTELNRRYPSDAALTAYLRHLPSSERIVIGELCGVGSAAVPLDFGWSGRIAAFSGRLGVCGWARHAMLYNSPLQQEGFRAQRVEQKLSGYLRSYQELMNAIMQQDRRLVLIYTTALKDYGVTHLVFGEQEKRIFPLLNIDEIGKSIGVPPLLRLNSGTGILVLK